MILVTHPSLPVKSAADMVALIKSKPGQLNYASAGSGSANHLAMELFMHATRLELTHVPYKGGAPAVADLLGGQIPMMFITIPPALPHAKAGKLRVLAVSSAKRSPTLPDVPTVAESGTPGFDFNEWQAILAPRARRGRGRAAERRNQQGPGAAGVKADVRSGRPGRGWRRAAHRAHCGRTRWAPSSGNQHRRREMRKSVNENHRFPCQTAAQGILKTAMCERHGATVSPASSAWSRHRRRKRNPCRCCSKR